MRLIFFLFILFPSGCIITLSADTRVTLRQISFLLRPTETLTVSLLKKNKHISSTSCWSCRQATSSRLFPHQTADQSAACWSWVLGPVLYSLTAPDCSGVNVLFCYQSAQPRCLCGRLLWWAALSLFAQCRIDRVAEWHVRECCDVLRSPPGQQGDRGAPSLRLPPLSHWWRTDWLWSDLSASSWWCMEQQAWLQLWDVCVHLCGSLTKCFPSVKCHCCSLFLSAGSTSQSRWFTLFPKFQSWLHGESLANVELFILILTFEYTGGRAK